MKSVAVAATELCEAFVAKDDFDVKTEIYVYMEIVRVWLNWKHA